MQAGDSALIPLREQPTDAETRSDLYRQFAAAFAHPDEQMAESILNGDWFSGVQTIAARLPYPNPFKGAAVRVEAGATRDSLLVFYSSRFESGAREVSLRESAYVKVSEKSLMEEVFRFYKHFGLDVARLTVDGLVELPDHLCVELEFLHYLTFLEACTLRSPGTDANLSALRRGQKDFLQRHPGSWIPALTTKLDRIDSTGFYLGAAELLSRFVQQEVLFLTQQDSTRRAS